MISFSSDRLQHQPVKTSKISTKKFRSLLVACAGASLGILSSALQPKLAESAEKIYVPYGPFEFSLEVDSLAAYAKSGEVSGELGSYFRFLDAQARSQLRQTLQWRLDVSHIAISQFTYSPTGERLIKRLGEVIQTSRDRNGFQALRAALILAARDPEGLTLVNVMRRFPTQRIWINTKQLLALQKEVSTFIDYRDTTLGAIAKQMDAEIAAQPATNFSNLPDPRQPGSFKVARRTLDLTNNRNRQSAFGEKIGRTFEVDLYVPEGKSQTAPIVVISHGLGSDRSGFSYLAEHLASHGFAVVVPQHIGSDLKRRQALLAGIVRSDLNPVEFIDRPLDIKYTLDELERLSKSDPNLKNKLNLNQIGIIGHSTGGYTALAMAGAEINHERLGQECQEDRPTLNISVLLQCLGDRLPSFNYNLQDSRIKAAIAISPFTSTILGPESLSNIQIPTMIVGSADDFITPVIPEQIHPFFWLKTAKKYLAVITSSGHTAVDTTEVSNDPLSGFGQLLGGANPKQSREYVKALSLAFVQNYLSDRAEYQAYLTPAYARSISQEPLKLGLVRELDSAQVEQAFGKKPPLPIFPPLATAPVANRDERILEEVKQTGTLKVGIVKNAAPFGYEDTNGKWTGYCHDLSNSLASQLQQQFSTPVKLEVTQATLENRFELIQKEQVHFVCGPFTIREDIAGVGFSTPFFITGTHFLVPTENKDKIDPANNLRNVRVGVLRRSTTEQFMRSRYPQLNTVYFEGAGSGIAAVQALGNGTIDAFASDGILLVAGAVGQNLSLNNYTLVPEKPLNCEAYGLVLPTNDRQWQGIVNSFIGSQQARQVWEQWFKNLYPYIYLTLDYCADR